MENSVDINQKYINYIVYIDDGDGKVKVKSEIDGIIDFTGTDAARVINTTLNNLTVGRLWKEKLTLIGDFYLSDEIEMAPNCILDLYNARLIPSGCVLAINTKNITDSMILGGTIDGQNQTDGNINTRCIDVNTCDRIIIKDIEIKNSGYYGLNLWDSNDCTIDNVYSHDNYRHGVHLGGDNPGRNQYNITVNCRCYSNGVDGINDRGSTLTDENIHNSYINDICKGNGQHGFYFSSGMATIERTNKFYVVNCQSFNNTKFGFRFAECGGIIMNPVAMYNSEHGVEVAGCSNLSVINPLLTHNGQTPWKEGLRILDGSSAPSSHITVIGGEIRDNYRNININSSLGSDDISIAHVDVRGGIYSNVNLQGTITNLRITGLNGFKTKNSGKVTIPNGYTSIKVAHDLASTPTVVTLGATHSEVSNAVWNADTKNITISVGSAVTSDRYIGWYAEYNPYT